MGREVLGAPHHRSAGGERFEVLFGWRCDLGTTLFDIGPGAQRRDVAAAELPPVGEDRRKDLADLNPSERQEPVPRASREGPLQAPGKRGFQLGGVVAGSEQETTVRRQAGSQAKRVGGCCAQGRFQEVAPGDDTPAATSCATAPGRARPAHALDRAPPWIDRVPGSATDLGGAFDWWGIEIIGVKDSATRSRIVAARSIDTMRVGDRGPEWP